jgi:hypothetical protein
MCDHTETCSALRVAHRFVRTIAQPPLDASLWSDRRPQGYEFKEEYVGPGSALADHAPELGARKPASVF